MNNKDFQPNKVDSAKSFGKAGEGNKIERVGDKIARDGKAQSASTSKQWSSDNKIKR